MVDRRAGRVGVGSTFDGEPCDGGHCQREGEQRLRVGMQCPDEREYAGADGEASGAARSVRSSSVIDF